MLADGDMDVRLAAVARSRRSGRLTLLESVRSFIEHPNRFAAWLLSCALHRPELPRPPHSEAKGGRESDPLAHFAATALSAWLSPAFARGSGGQ